jgi:hypothetical protein
MLAPEGGIGGEKALNATQQLFKDNGIDGITLKYTPIPK